MPPAPWRPDRSPLARTASRVGSATSTVVLANSRIVLVNSRFEFVLRRIVAMKNRFGGDRRCQFPVRVVIGAKQTWSEFMARRSGTIADRIESKRELIPPKQKLALAALENPKSPCAHPRGWCRACNCRNLSRATWV
jgi:hypothetical protein